MQDGLHVDETGILIREGCAFYLRRDAGGRFLLDLPRTPVDEVEKRVRISGIARGDDVVEVEGVALIGPA
jgi:CO/xanthine dehydrogenase FAD-binding subunit